MNNPKSVVNSHSAVFTKRLDAEAYASDIIQKERQLGCYLRCLRLEPSYNFNKTTGKTETEGWKIYLSFSSIPGSDT